MMKLQNIPFNITNWEEIPSQRYEGEKGYALWQVQQFDQIRVRMVTYSVNYLADHWCLKGHILFCIDSELSTELKDGRIFTLHAGMSYQVADHAEAHRSFTAKGAKLFIVD